MCLKLYHYSSLLYPTLLTKRKSGAASKEEIKQAERRASGKGPDMKPYVDHISFFFDPIPSVMLSRIFGTNHQVWFTGSKLYEYTVTVDSLSDDFSFEVVESAQRTKLLDVFSEKHDWVNDNPATLKLWEAHEIKHKLQWGEIGRGKQALKVQMLGTDGDLGKAFLSAYNRPDFEDGRFKYAANVPHVMIYPSSGEIQYTAVERLTIGKNKRDPL